MDLSIVHRLLGVQSDCKPYMSAQMPTGRPVAVIGPDAETDGFVPRLPYSDMMRQKMQS